MPRQAARPSVRRQGGLIVATFAVVGAALGVVGFVTADWARTQFVTAATGSTPETFGPVFLALSVFQTTVTLLFAGPVVAAMLGLLSGSRFPDGATAGGVAAGGALVGFFVMSGLGLAGLSLLTGTGTRQTYALGSAAGPLLLTGVVTAVTGGAAGVMGSRFVR
ncbi:MAG: hypothetical protein ABEI80_05240 [Haloplanus sp.]